MKAKLIIERTERNANEMEIFFRLADAIPQSDLQQVAEDLIDRHVNEVYPNRTIRTHTVTVGQDLKGYARVTGYAE